MRLIATLFIASVLVFLSQTAMAQQKQIALHHQGAVSMFTSLTDAYNAAVNGDTLYLPGGFYEAIGLWKSLTLIGVGHNPDSTAATGATVIQYLDFNSGSDGSFIQGFFFNSTLNCNDNISGVTISRCYLNQGIIFHDFNYQNPGWLFSENYINIQPNWGFSIVLGGSFRENFTISNNVFYSSIGLYGRVISFSVITNNIFLNNSGVSAANSTFNNNIFSGNQLGITSYCQWHNNLNSGINGNDGSNMGSGNYLGNISLESVFVNYSPGNTFYQNDFHVVNPAYIGNDGTPVGIYGGPFPWKEGSLPANPHISSKVISSVTNPDGTLHINVEVNAQQH